MLKTTPNFGNVLRKERKRLGLTLQALAEKIHIGMNNYAHYEMGVRHPHDVEMWNKLADLFKWTPNEVIKYQKQVKKEYEEAVNVE